MWSEYASDAGTELNAVLQRQTWALPSPPPPDTCMPMRTPLEELT